MDNNVILDNATLESMQNLTNEISSAGSIMGAATADTTVVENQLEGLNSARAVMGGGLSEEEMMKMYAQPRKTPPMVRNYKKIGRNDTCPCGSGKKYKNCCLGTGTYDGYTAYGKQKDPYVKEENTEAAA